jgi:replicative DNA helicase
MNAESELFRAYREWQRLARAETKAIQTRNWKLLSECHSAIRDFQVLIADLTQKVRSEWRRSGCDLQEKEGRLHVFVNALLELTRGNRELLRATLAVARTRLADLTETGNNLKRLRRSYGLAAARNRLP